MTLVFAAVAQPPTRRRTGMNPSDKSIMPTACQERFALRTHLSGLGRFDAAVAALCAALQAYDSYTAEHSCETSELAEEVAARLGVDRVTAELVTLVAALHDVGKIGIPTEILGKPDRLTEAEFDVMRQHPVIGERILGSVPELAAVAHAIRHEHERWDGDGYPDGLAGTEIPLASRIVFACDAWHAMTSDRPYRHALSHEEALAELRRCAGSQFDPSVVEALLAVLAERLALAA
jgi:putative nucleotidyltransferase with HDIG domain